MADLATICGSSLYSNITICKVMEIIDEHIARAEDELANANDELDALATAVTAGVSSFDGVNYVSQTAGINKTFAPQDTPDFSPEGPTPPSFPTAPTTGTLSAVTPAEAIPTAYTVPSASTLLISQADFDEVFDSEEDRLNALHAAEEREASYNSASRGVGKASAALSIGLQKAQQKTAMGVSTAARDSANAEATMLRDDAKTVHGLHLQNWPLRPRLVHDSHVAQEDLEIRSYTAGEKGKTDGYQTIVNGLAAAYDSQVKWVLGHLNAETDRLRVLISSETERRGWSKMAIDNALMEAESLTKYALEKMEYLTSITRDTQQAKAQLVTGAFQALISAANVNLSGSGSQAVSE